MKQEFPLAPLHRSAWLLLVVLWVILMLVAYLAPHHPQSAANPVPWWLVVPFGTALVVVGPWVMLQHRRISIEGDKLVAEAALLFTRKLAMSELALDKARVLNLDEHTEFKPMLQLGGMSLPGFNAGHYLLRNRSRAFCLLTARDSVLLLPQHDGKLILLSPKEPQALLARLRELASQRLPAQKLAQETARR
ncbi:MAG TPA: hypothetical protein VET30_04665 [Pseudoxanthomonas sp.]|nr:hypothetical protein [Pseudoxanthomonas sp.]